MLAVQRVFRFATPSKVSAGLGRILGVMRAAMLVLVLVLLGAEGFAQSTQPDFERRLAAGHHSRFSGRSLRETLNILARATRVQYWLDRRVDSSQWIDVPAAGPTVEQAFSNTAAAAGLVSLPIDNLVLVGRADWVDHAGTLILAAGSRARPGLVNGQPGIPVSEVSAERPLAISWPLLTTPEEALKLVAEQLQMEVGAIRLAHDLWPAFSSDSIRATTLLTLIGCEFDVWLRSDAEGGLRSDSYPDEFSIEKEYPAELVTAAVEEIKRIEAGTVLTGEGDQTMVRGGARVHRMLQSRARANRQPAVRPRNRPPATTAAKRFTIHWERAPAVKALQTLAQAGGWTLVMAPATKENGSRLINVQVEDMPLKDLVTKVAEQVELTATWNGDTLNIDVR